jgi:hypothetical protein
MENWVGKQAVAIVINIFDVLRRKIEKGDPDVVHSCCDHNSSIGKEGCVISS